MWIDGYFRAFISYSGEDDGYALATEAKNKLELWGISAFVDKNDIQKGSPWRTSLLEALNSTHIIIALLTPQFKISDWADQEIGFAISRGIPAFPVNYGIQPYGFFGEFQEMEGDQDWVKELPQILLARADLCKEYLSAYIEGLRAVDSFDKGNLLSKLLPFIQTITPKQIKKIRSVYEENFQLKSSYGFNGESSFHYGEGLDYHINRLTKAEDKIIPG